MQPFIQILMAFTGSAGFAILFHTRKSRILPAALGGAASWSIYLALEHLLGGFFAPCLIAAAFAAAYAEVLARIEKSPATVFFISSAIPLIPGSALYYTMSSLVIQDFAAAAEYGGRTILYMVAIAVGASLIGAVLVMEQRLKGDGGAHADDCKVQGAAYPLFPEAAQQKRLLHLILDLGEMMLDAGADINRVEDTLGRIGTAYGAQMNVFVIIYSIVITMSFPGNIERTLTRRVQNSTDLNFERIERLNDLSRRCCAKPMPLDELAKELDAIRHSRDRGLRQFVGNMLGAFSFAVFFGGSAADGLAAALFAVLIVLIIRYLGRLCPNRIIFNLLISLLVGIGIGVFCRLLSLAGLGIVHRDRVMIGDIMLLNPGITMVNAVREMMVGNMISGQMRLSESVLFAIALAGGFMLALMVTGV